jgi:formylglycine-generating enzyme required for sulfatase activity
MSRRCIFAVVILALYACGGPSGDGTHFVEETRARWQVLDLATGRMQGLGDIPDLATNPDYRDRLMAFRLVPGGAVSLGAGGFARQSDEEHGTYDLPPCYVAACETTRAQWLRISGTSPWVALTPATTAGTAGAGDDVPAVGIGPDTVAVALAQWNAAHGDHLRLPAPHAWEAAARAGSAGSQPWGEDRRLSTVRRYAVTWEGGAGGPQPAFGRLPNALGLYDMCGNVWELVADGTARGGSWADASSLARPANRITVEPDAVLPTVGVRLSCVP